MFFDTAIGRKVAILGSMFELSENEKQMHYDVGMYLDQITSYLVKSHWQPLHIPDSPDNQKINNLAKYKHFHGQRLVVNDPLPAAIHHVKYIVLIWEKLPRYEKYLTGHNIQ